MNELRWILLIAGALLIAGIYAWGLRSRGRRPGGEEPARRPAVFSGGAQGFEATGTDAASTADEAPPELREPRRIEPSVAIDEDALDTQRPAIERRAEPVITARPEPAVGGRIEPTLGPSDEVAPAVPPWDEPTVEPAPAAQAPRPVATPAATETPDATAKPKRPPQRIFAVRVSAAGTSRFAGQRVLEALEAEGLRFGRYDIFHCLHADGRPVFSVASLRDPGTFDLQTMATTQYPGILVFTVLPGPVGASEAFDDMLFTARALATHLEGALADERGVPLTAHRAGRLREEALEFERSLHAA